MRIQLYLLFFIGAFCSCNQSADQESEPITVVVHDTIRLVEKTIDTVYIQKENEYQLSEYYIRERLPDWFLETDMLDGKIFQDRYEFDNRLNPLYLEADLNGDGNLDISIPVKEISSSKVGFAVIHGNTHEVFILGAGTTVKNGLSDDQSYIDIWIINRENNNPPGLDENGEIDPNGPLILENPSIRIEKSETGGGLIYWNGKEYAYFHQTC